MEGAGLPDRGVLKWAHDQIGGRRLRGGASRAQKVKAKKLKKKGRR